MYSVFELTRDHPSTPIILAGDFNQLPEQAIIQRTGLVQLVRQSTRGTNILDRIFESRPLYNIIRVVAATVRSDHKAVVAYDDQCYQVGTVKTSTKRTYRKITPSQHAQFLKYLSDNVNDIILKNLTVYKTM